MKYFLSLALYLVLAPLLLAQVAGNSSYQTRVRYDDSNLRANTGSGADISISAKGLANVKADVFIAVFSVSQIANTPERYKFLRRFVWPLKSAHLVKPRSKSQFSSL